MNIVDNKYDLPRDVIDGYPIINVIGNKQIEIENFDRVKYISSSEILITNRKMNIRLSGNGINIDYYSGKCAIISGVFNEILFL